MGSKYNDVVITDSGTAIMAAAQAGSTITFTAVKTGDGTYDGTEDLESMTDLLSVKQSFGITGITVSSSDDSIAIVRSIVSNKGLTTGYTITEIGLFATDPDTETEVLFAIITATEGAEDTLPPYSETPTAITFEIYISTENVSDGVVFEASEVEGTYVSTEDFNDYSTQTDEDIDSLKTELAELKQLVTDNYSSLSSAISTVQAKATSAYNYAEDLNVNLITKLWSGSATEGESIALSISAYYFNTLVFSFEDSGLRASCPIVASSQSTVKAGGLTVTSTGHMRLFGLSGTLSNNGKTLSLDYIGAQSSESGSTNSELSDLTLISVYGLSGCTNDGSYLN